MAYGTNPVSDMCPHPVLTIDGPAGSGKSSTAKAVAEELGWRHLNSGALYRAFALGLIQRGIPKGQWPALSEDETREVAVTLQPTRWGFDVLLDDRLVSGELHDSDVTVAASVAAALPTVRRCLLAAQRRAVTAGPVVADGRDMGSVVFPDAVAKVFLVADLEVRARRRLRDLGHGPPNTIPRHLINRCAQELADRDERDLARREAPLVRPEGSHLINTSGLDFGQQVELVAELARRAVGCLPASQASR